jgi:hypothetical protein
MYMMRGYVDLVTEIKILFSYSINIGKISITHNGSTPRVSDKGIATKACYLSIPGAHSGYSPWKLGPSIVIVKYEIMS